MICLDGAPQRLSMQSDKHAVAAAERRFCSIVMRRIGSYVYSPCLRVDGGWNDGLVYAFEYEYQATNICHHIGTLCHETNKRDNLPWEWQFHPRAGVGRSFYGALNGLLLAWRDELHVVGADDRPYHSVSREILVP